MILKTLLLLEEFCVQLINFEFLQVRFFMVSEEELESLRKDFKHGKYKIKTEYAKLKLGEYNSMVVSIADEIGERA